MGFAILSQAFFICALWGRFGLLTLLLQDITAESTLASKNPNLALKIDQPRRHTIEKYIHQLDSNVILVNKTGILTLRLDCWAPYPIDLKFYGHLTNQETTVKTFRKEYGTTDSPKSWFIINATMETYEQTTGNYTCVSVENPTLFSSYYIFVSPTPPGVLLTRGQKIIIRMKPEDTKVVFPCAVSHPEVHVQLYKGDDEATLSDGVVYDPKIGFSMAIKLDDSSAFGNYSCRTELSPNDLVNFKLMRPKNFRVEPKINNIRITPDEYLNVSCDATENFVIVSQPPTLRVIRNEVKYVGNSSLWNEPFYKFKGSFISQPHQPNISGYVDCNWKSSNKTFARWTFSVSRRVKKVGYLDTAKLTSACPNTTNLIHFECSNPVECRINSCFRKDPHCTSNERICKRDRHCMQNGLVQCVSDSTSVVEYFFTGFPTKTQPNTTTRYVEWRHASHEELLLLEQVPPLTHYNKEKVNVMRFTCQGSNFVFSSGFKWTIYFQNATKVVITSMKVIKDDDMNMTVNNSWKEKRSNLESTLTISAGNSSRRIVSFIECQAPVWNSWQWISRKIPVELNFFRKRNVVENSVNSSCLPNVAVVALFLLHLCFVG